MNCSPGITLKTERNRAIDHSVGRRRRTLTTLVRSIGIVRAKARIGLKNLAYNMRRYVQLERLAVAPP